MEQGVFGGCLLCPLYPLLTSLNKGYHYYDDDTELDVLYVPKKLHHIGS